MAVGGCEEGIEAYVGLKLEQCVRGQKYQSGAKWQVVQSSWWEGKNYKFGSHHCPHLYHGEGGVLTWRDFVKSAHARSQKRQSCNEGAACNQLGSHG